MISTLVVNTVVSQGPIVFVSLAESKSGEFDVYYQADTYGYDAAMGFNLMNMNYYSV